jgi:polar amino acid transport system permease protein
MTTAWDFVQRAIERRFGRAYEQMGAATEQR